MSSYLSPPSSAAPTANYSIHVHFLCLPFKTPAAWGPSKPCLPCSSPSSRAADQPVLLPTWTPPGLLVRQFHMPTSSPQPFLLLSFHSYELLRHPPKPLEPEAGRASLRTPSCRRPLFSPHRRLQQPRTVSVTTFLLKGLQWLSIPYWIKSKLGSMAPLP